MDEDREITDPINEARRYVANAEEVIMKAKYDPVTKSYSDSKYVKTAGNILWSGCLGIKCVASPTFPEFYYFCGKFETSWVLISTSAMPDSKG